MNALIDNVFVKFYADKGYISQTLFVKLWDKVVHIVTGLRSNMKQKLMPLYDKIMLRKRNVIESVNDMLKNVPQIVHTLHRSLHNFIMNILAAMGGQFEEITLSPESCYQRLTGAPGLWMAFYG